MYKCLCKLRPISVCRGYGKREDKMAEWSKAVASGAIPKGRGFKSHSCHAFQQHPHHPHTHTFFVVVERRDYNWFNGPAGIG